MPRISPPTMKSTNPDPMRAAQENVKQQEQMKAAVQQAEVLLEYQLKLYHEVLPIMNKRGEVERYQLDRGVEVHDLISWVIECQTTCSNIQSASRVIEAAVSLFIGPAATAKQSKAQKEFALVSTVLGALFATIQLVCFQLGTTFEEAEDALLEKEAAEMAALEAAEQDEEAAKALAGATA